MSAERPARPWSSPETELVLETGAEGRGQPTGRVCCPECGECAQRPEDVEHERDCDQPRYTSEWDRPRRASD